MVVDYVAHEDAARQVVAEIEAGGAHAVAVRCDVANGEQVEGTVARAVDSFGGWTFW